MAPGPQAHRGWSLAALRARRRELIPVVRRHGGRRVLVVGSVARGEAGRRSDVDLLVDFAPGSTLLEQGAMVAELEELLGCPVDVLALGGLEPELRERLLAEGEPL